MMAEFSNMSCEPYSSSTVKFVHGAHRLVTPTVSQLSSQHFGCHLQTDVFGPVLQTLVLPSSVFDRRQMCLFLKGIKN